MGAPDPPITYGCESPYDAGLGTGDRISWQAGMSRAGGGGGAQRFCWMGQAAWPGDFIEPPVPGALPANAPINGDADFLNWGVNTADIVFYIGHGNPDAFTFTYPCFPSANPISALWKAQFNGVPAVRDHIWNQCGAQVDMNVLNYPGSWRTCPAGAPWPNDTLEWLCLLSCEVLANPGAPTPWQRWGRELQWPAHPHWLQNRRLAGDRFPAALCRQHAGTQRRRCQLSRRGSQPRRRVRTGRTARAAPLPWGR